MSIKDPYLTSLSLSLECSSISFHLALYRIPFSYQSLGDYACFGSHGHIGFESCDGLNACFGSRGRIGTMVLTNSSLAEMDTDPRPSCIDPTMRTEDDLDDPDDVSEFEGVCMNNAAEEIGEHSCIDGERVCTYNGLDLDMGMPTSPRITIGDNSCQSDNACYHNRASIGDDSW